MSKVNSQWQINEMFCTMTEGTDDQLKSSGDAEHYAQRQYNRGHKGAHVRSVMQFRQTVVELSGVRKIRSAESATER